MALQVLVFDSRRGNTEGYEAEKLLGYFPESLEEHQKIATAGLLQGLHTFSDSLADADNYDPFEIAEMDSNTWVMYEVEPSLYLAALCSKTWLPRHVSHASLRGLLLHTYNLMAVLMGGIQWTLDKDASGETTRRMIVPILNHIGNEVLLTDSWLSKELRNPFTVLGRPGMAAVSLPIILEVHSFVHRIAASSCAMSSSIGSNCVVFFRSMVLWSTHSMFVTAGLAALLHAAVLPTERGKTSSSSKGSSSIPKNYERLENGFIVEKGARGNGAGIQEYSLPCVYIDFTLRPILVFCTGDFVAIMDSDQSSVTNEDLNTLHSIIHSCAEQIEGSLMQENQSELGHSSGWRFVMHGPMGSHASTRDKISSMSHHARAVGKSVLDSLVRHQSVREACALSDHGVWVMGGSKQADAAPPNLVVRLQKLSNAASISVSALDEKYRSLALV